MTRWQKSTFTPAYAFLRERLVEMRVGAGLTQRQLAARLGREQSFVARIEKGERRLDLVEFARVVRACKQSPSAVAVRLIRRIVELDRA